MRHPDTQGGLPIHRVIDTLKKENYSVIVSLESRDDENLDSLWTDATHRRHRVFIPDFPAQSVKQSYELCQIITEAARQNENVVIHCGEGWGRTGTALSSIQLMALIQEIPADSNYWSSTPNQSETIQMGKHCETSSVTTTYFVAQAITKIRQLHADQRNKKSTHGSSVENTGQIRALEAFEAYLRRLRTTERFITS